MRFCGAGLATHVMGWVFQPPEGSGSGAGDATTAAAYQVDGRRGAENGAAELGGAGGVDMGWVNGTPEPGGADYAEVGAENGADDGANSSAAEIGGAGDVEMEWDKGEPERGGAIEAEVRAENSAAGVGGADDAELAATHGADNEADHGAAEIRGNGVGDGARIGRRHASSATCAKTHTHRVGTRDGCCRAT